MNFAEFSNKINNPYNIAPQKCLKFFDKFGQVKWENKITKMLKKKQIVNDRIYEKFQISIFFRNIFHDFPKLFDKISNP